MVLVSFWRYPAPDPYRLIRIRPNDTDPYEHEERRSLVNPPPCICEECDQNSTVRLTEGTIDPCQEVKVALLGATRETVVGLWGKVTSGSYQHFENWVQGRPVYYKTEDHNFTLSVLPVHKAWGFSDQADAKYAYIVASYENGNMGPNSPGDVDRWDYYPGHDWGQELERRRAS